MLTCSSRHCPTRAPANSSGVPLNSTRQQRRVASGILGITQLSALCAQIKPPCSETDSQPRVPSLPKPLNIIAPHREPKAAAVVCSTSSISGFCADNQPPAARLIAPLPSISMHCSAGTTHTCPLSTNCVSPSSATGHWLQRSSCSTSKS